MVRGSRTLVDGLKEAGVVLSEDKLMKGLKLLI